MCCGCVMCMGIPPCGKGCCIGCCCMAIIGCICWCCCHCCGGAPPATGSDITGIIDRGVERPLGGTATCCICCGAGTICAIGGCPGKCDALALWNVICMPACGTPWCKAGALRRGVGVVHLTTAVGVLTEATWAGH